MRITQEHQMVKEVIQKAWEDTTFKNELIANPVDAIEKLTGVKLDIPKGKVLVVTENGNQESQTNTNIIYLNIPEPIDFSNIELTDEQLEFVSGGVPPNEASIAIADKIGSAWNNYWNFIGGLIKKK